MSYDPPEQWPEQTARDRVRREKAERERKDWAELYHIYERCVGIAEKIWKEKLDTAAAQQQTLAEQMRDRCHVGVVGGFNYAAADGEIPVPLFTPRDRLQFVKEVGATLLISADRRNLTALYKDPNGETELAQTKEAPAGEGPVEAASRADEMQSDEAQPDAPLALGVEAPGYGERLSEAPAPRV